MGNAELLITVDDAERVPDLKRGAHLFVQTPAGVIRTKERVLHADRNRFHCGLTSTLPCSSSNPPVASLVQPVR